MEGVFCYGEAEFGERFFLGENMRQMVNGILVAAVLFAAAPALADVVQARIIYTLPHSEQTAGLDRFDLKMRAAGIDQGTLWMTYEVAPDLLGKEGRYMTMFGKVDQPGDFVDLFCGETSSEAKCARSGDHLTCSVKFRNLTPDAAQVESYLRAKYGENEQLAARLFASHIFGLDAIGTLDIKVDGL